MFQAFLKRLEYKIWMLKTHKHKLYKTRINPNKSFKCIDIN